MVANIRFCRIKLSNLKPQTIKLFKPFKLKNNGRKNPIKQIYQR